MAVSSKTFGAGAAAGTQTPQQLAEQYMLNPSYVPSSTRFNSEPGGSFYSANPTEMASAWDLPPNAGSLQLPTGISTSTPSSPQAQSTVTQSIQMLTLYGALASGKKLTSAEMNAANKLGGDIARAAQLAGKPNGASAAIKAQKEITSRLESTVGVNPQTLTSEKGLDGKVDKNFATVMQNAGYGVTSQMTYKQALTATSSGKPPASTVSQPLTVAQYLQNLSSLPASDISSLQASLYNGGFFDQEYYAGENGATKVKPYTQGVLDTATKLAMRQAILQTLANSSTGKPSTLEDTLGGGADGSGQPILGTVGSGGATPSTVSSTTTAPLATEAQTQSPLITAFQIALGRAPTQAELQSFTASYEQQLLAGSKTLTEQGLGPSGAVDYQSGVPFVQGTPTVAAAATSFAENQDQSEYQAHGVANAFGLLMKLIDRPATSSLDTIGASPQATA